MTAACARWRYLLAAVALLKLAATPSRRATHVDEAPPLLPCPAWCGSAAGHPWEVPEPNGSRARFHHDGLALASGWGATVVDRANGAGAVLRGQVEVFDPSALATDVEALRVAHFELGELVAALG